MTNPHVEIKVKNLGEMLKEEPVDEIVAQLFEILHIVTEGDKERMVALTSYLTDIVETG